MTYRYLADLASQIPGVDVNRWQTARNDRSLVRRVVSEAQAAGATGINGTPTLVFQAPAESTAVPEAIPTFAQLKQVLQSVA